jgi:HEPN domain-containing protein
MNRKDLQTLSELRLKEASALLRAGHFSGAYYLAGYSVECAFKACIAKKTQQYEFPDRERVLSSYVHSLEKLSAAADLAKALDADCKRNKRLLAFWDLVRNWSEQSRYKEYSEEDASDLVDAIHDHEDGVLQWIKRFW